MNFSKTTGNTTFLCTAPLSIHKAGRGMCDINLWRSDAFKKKKIESLADNCTIVHMSFAQEMGLKTLPASIDIYILAHLLYVLQ